MENAQGTRSSAAQKAGVECIIDQVEVKTVWEQKPIDMKLISEMVDNLTILDESAEITSNILNLISSSFSSEESFNLESLNVSIFPSSTPVQKGPILRRMDKLAFSDFTTANFSPILSVAASTAKVDALSLSIFKSSTPVQQRDFLRRFDKLTFNDYVNYKCSPISSELEKAAENKTYLVESSTRRKLEF